MTVESTTSRVQYNTNGTTGPWTVPFYFLEDGDLLVTYADTDGAEDTLTLTTDYSVTGAGVQSGGTVTTVTAYAASGTITITRSVSALQEVDYVETDSFPAATHETALDRLTMLAQQLGEENSRSLHFPISDDTDSELPAPADRALKLLGFGVGGVLGMYPLADAPAGTQERINVKDYGAVGDGVTDDTDAIVAAFDAVVALGGGALYFPMGTYKITAMLDFYRANSPRVDIEIWGDGQHSTKILCAFYGAADAAIQSRDPLGLTRSSPISFYDIGFEHDSSSGGVNPLFIDVLGWGESRAFGVRFGSSNNTHARFTSAQNCRLHDFVSFYGGRHFAYKDTTGITFSVNGGTKVITASAAIFSAGDVGKHFFILPANDSRRIRYTIAVFTDTTHVTVTEDALTETAEAGIFEPARATINSASTTLTANASVFTSEMVGLVLYIRGGKAGSYGTQLLRATISAYISATQVTLDTAATATATDQYFGLATVDMGKESGFAGSSDVKASMIHIEHYDGIGFVAQDTDSYQVVQSKIHGETEPTSTTSSLAAMWLDDHGGSFEVELDSTCSMSDCRVYLCNFNDLAFFNSTVTRGIIHGTVFKSELFTNAGGYAFIQGLNTYVDFSDPYDIVVDANHTADETDPRILLTGPINMIGDSQKARYYVGRDTYFSPDGSLTTAQSIDDTIIASTITWDSTPPSGTVAKRYIWEKVGRFVEGHFRLEYTVAGTTNSTVTIALPADMPTPASMGGQDNSEIAYPALGFLGTSAASTALSRAVLQKNGSGTFEIVVSLNSGTISAAFCSVMVKYPAAL